MQFWKGKINCFSYSCTVLATAAMKNFTEGTIELKISIFAGISEKCYIHNTMLGLNELSKVNNCS